MRILTSLLVLVALAPLPAQTATAAEAAECALPDVQPAIAALVAHGVAIDSNKACRAAVLAVARSADPGAEFRDPSEKPAPAATPVEAAEAWAENIRYLKLRGLDKDAATNVEERINAWLSRDCAGLILDLRSAAGDDLAAVDRLAAFFTGGTGTFYTVRSLRGPPEPHPGSSPSRWRTDVPLLVLTDRDTRDGSELLAALLRGRPGVMLVGGATRGDASVRELVSWSEHEGLWIATGRIELQGGGAYEPDGVAPDVQIAKSADPAPREDLPEETATGRPLSARAREDRSLLLRTAGDATLRRALEILLALKAVRMDTK